MNIKKSMIAFGIITFFSFGLNSVYAQVKNLAQTDFANVVKKEKAIVMDVRTEGEVASGYIKGTTLFADVNSSDFNAKISKLDKSKTYIIYCRSGARSGKAANIMVQNGFKNVYNLNGGIMNWSGEVISH
ncbi:MAG: rhodanese-like domain-containing protein [Bacteroidia bacterium]|jgi:rhodanese-related sulfurtransferase|nr:rhodanese-like domain-containing protein [Bacteroidia bacterium]